MNANITTVAIGITCLMATTSMSLHAASVDLAVTGTVHSLGLDANAESLGTITHSVSKRVEKGKKGLGGNTAVSSSKTFSNGFCTMSDDQNGGFYEYEFAEAVSTTENGDLMYAELDTSQVNGVCARGALREINVHRIISGGTGDLSTACGYLHFSGTGLALGANLTAIEGTHIGEIFFDSNEAPEGTLGCP